MAMDKGASRGLKSPSKKNISLLGLIQNVQKLQFLINTLSHVDTYIIARVGVSYSENDNSETERGPSCFSFLTEAALCRPFLFHVSIAQLNLV